MEEPLARQAMERAVLELVDALRNHHTGTADHSNRLASQCRLVAEALGLRPDVVFEVELVAILHDIGKLAVSNRILDKPAALTAAEYDRVRQHPLITERILARVPGCEHLAPLAGSHHERLDGGGYHLGLTGDQLNRDARILAVADVFEALTAERPYRAALPLEQVRAIMRRDAPHALCPKALAALEASQDLGVLTLLTPARASTLPLAR